MFSKKAVILNVASMSIVASCGVGGGIIDNGNKPKDPEEQKEEATAGDSVPSPSVANSQPSTYYVQVILQNYSVSVPENPELSPAVEGTSSIVLVDGKTATFSFTDDTCVVTPETNAANFKLFRCSPVLSVIEDPQGVRMKVEHWERDQVLETILTSISFY